jgi:hypothetical protein
VLNSRKNSIILDPSICSTPDIIVKKDLDTNVTSTNSNNERQQVNNDTDTNQELEIPLPEISNSIPSADTESPQPNVVAEELMPLAPTVARDTINAVLHSFPILPNNLKVILPAIRRPSSTSFTHFESIDETK